MKTNIETEISGALRSMKEEIRRNLDNPRQLEMLYQDNKMTFKRAFNLTYPEIQEEATARVWHERLNFEMEEISFGTGKDLLFIIGAIFMAGLIAKIPDFIGLDHGYFYPRNIAFIVLPFLTAYFAWKQKLPVARILMVIAVYAIAVVYMNLLPDNSKSDTLLLACIHLPLFLWAVLGTTFVGNRLNDFQKRIEFLRFNGDLVVMTAITMISCFLLTAVTVGLFQLIDVNIETALEKYILVWGVPAVPIVAMFLVRNNPQLVNKVSPIIARVFTPLVFVMLVVYLVAVVITGKNPYNDRDFLLIFNVLLIGVMALILFSISETSQISESRMGRMLLLALSLTTIVVNSIALSAIVFRISEWGITPNRLAVLGSNVLILTHLLIVSYRLFRTIRNSDEIGKVENSIATFLPVYVVWSLTVTFIFPVLFGFK